MATTPGSVSAPPPAPEPQASISPIGRIVGVLFSPKATFEDIARKPNWVLPVILSTLLGVIAMTALNQRVNWREYISQQVEKDPKAAQLTAEQKQQRVEAGAKITPIILYVAGLIGPIISVLLVAAVMMLAYNLLAGAGATFKQSFSITAHALLVQLISTPIFLLVLFLKPPGTLDVENPVATNIAAFLPEESAKWLVTLCKSFDIFTIWILILIAIGFAAVNPRKLKGARSFTIAFVAWGVYVVCHTLWAFIFS
jgi:Yip1 domain